MKRQPPPLPDLIFQGQDIFILDACIPAYAHLLPHVQDGSACITPSHQALTTLHLETKLYLRPSSAKAHLAQGEAGQIFPVLMDTGCSVTCSGYKEDFGDRLVPGNFGAIKTANGEAMIQGFGLVCWQTCDEEGTIREVIVPAYYCPDIQLRLFSPQDYA